MKDVVSNELVVVEKLGKQSLINRVAGGLFALALSAPVLAAEGDAAGVDFSTIGETIKTLIMGLIATIVLIGTAILTVLVAIKGFAIIKKAFGFA